MTVPRVDLKRLLRPVYDAKAEPSLVDVPTLPFLMVDGEGDPNSDGYRATVEGLYRVAYGVRALLKPVVSYSVLPSQGRWWTENGEPDPELDGDRSGWRWTMMIAQPEQVTTELVDAAVETVRKKSPTAASVRLETWTEGPSAQILHIGPYANETSTLQRLYAYVEQEGRTLAGRHHEIYLSDPRRVAPEKMRTILRYPVS